jgi:hypothetical protein
MAYTPIKSTIRDALQGQTLDGFDPSQFESQGGMIYYSLDSAPNQIDICSLVHTFRSIHLPSLGQFIPQSGEFLSATVADTPNPLVSPSNNQVFKVDTIGVQNATLGAITSTVSLKTTDSGSDDEVILSTESVASGTTKTISLQNPIYLDKNATLNVKASGASLTFTVYAYKVVQ